jgi:hypothetical protein
VFLFDKSNRYKLFLSIFSQGWVFQMHFSD